MPEWHHPHLKNKDTAAIFSLKCALASHFLVEVSGSFVNYNRTHDFLSKNVTENKLSALWFP